MTLAILVLVMAGIVTVSTLMTINETGKPRTVLTPGMVSAIVAVNAAIVVIMVLAALHIMH
jgi:hypothetical protein